MTCADIDKRIKAIEAIESDYEAAHAMEDVLWRDVLAAIASGEPNPVALAGEALRTTQLRFPRHAA